MHTKLVILAVDDDLLFRNLLEQQLQYIGYAPPQRTAWYS